MAPCNCGKKGQLLSYEVTAKNGKKHTVDTIGEARIFLNSNGGGSYKAIPRKK